MYNTIWDFPDDASSEEPACQCRLEIRDAGSSPWPQKIWKILWRRAWQPIPVFLPRESHGQRKLVGCSPLGHTESDMTEVT